MMRLALSPAAAGLLRALLARANVNRDRVLLTEFRSTDWQSLTFVGERHSFALRISGPDAGAVEADLTRELSEAEFHIPGHLVADIAVRDEPRRDADGSIWLEIEALTVATD
ncbi:hypothetical protein G7078_07985 [Sphingomonas sinipercae]|uniref:Uncharacterized protein n=1 Tax=Sphingomonas sinipercae TaxID=2714944 RepID=A0A6G7ZP04_9SPHN|nr:hypothetical protein [Sphingomonas sinipercae]QIL02727.1 hypothetical protein G7078_07985 [Sphingomonas sinipercae]